MPMCLGEITNCLARNAKPECHHTNCDFVQHDSISRSTNPGQYYWPKLKMVPPELNSLGKLKVFEGGDLEEPGELERAVRARSWGGEIVITFANDKGTMLITNLIMQLRKIGIEHHMVLVMEKNHCHALATSSAQISCAWTSWNFPGHSAQIGAERLFWSRIHYFARLIDMGVNPMIIDGDVTVQSDFYHLLKSADTIRHNLYFGLDHDPSCNMLNIGFMYCQNCSRNGPAQWVITESMQRFHEFDELDDVYRDTARNGRHAPYWRPYDKAGATAGPHGRGHRRDQWVLSDAAGASCCAQPDKVMNGKPSSAKVLNFRLYEKMTGLKDTCVLLKRNKNLPDAASVMWHELELPAFAERRETLAIAPVTMLGSWHLSGWHENAGVAGWWGVYPPTLAHFVGGKPEGKFNLIKAMGMYEYAAQETAREIIQNIQGGSRAHPPPPLPQRLLLIRGHHGSLLYRDQQVLLKHYASLRARLAAYAALLGRTAIQPTVDCGASWMPRKDNSWHGIFQRSGCENRMCGRDTANQWIKTGKLGAGANIASCTYPDGPHAKPGTLCCHPIYQNYMWDSLPLSWTSLNCWKTEHHTYTDVLMNGLKEHPQAAEQISLSKLFPSLTRNASLWPPEYVDTQAMLKAFESSAPILWLDMDGFKELPKLTSLQNHQLVKLENAVPQQVLMPTSDTVSLTCRAKFGCNKASFLAERGPSSKCDLLFLDVAHSKYVTANGNLIGIDPTAPFTDSPEFQK